MLLLSSFIFPQISSILSIFINFLITLLSKITKIFSQIPLGEINVIKPQLLLVILFYILIFFMRYIITIKKKEIPRRIDKKFLKFKKYITKKSMLCFAIIIILLFSFLKLIPQNLKIYMIDVGQGDCTLIRTTKGRTIMIDSGGQENLDEYDVGEKVLVPYLLARGITTLDYIMISHFHADHCNGFIAVLNEIKVKAMIIAKQEVYTKEAEKIIRTAKEKDVKIIYAKQNEKIKLDEDTYIEIMYIGKDVQNLNNNSIIARLKYRTFSMLFTGDAEKEEEADFLNMYKNVTSDVDILKVGHHGSATSTSQEFLEKVKPEIAIIGVGKNNKFGHPCQETLEKLNKNGAKIYRTDLMGEIIIEVDRQCKIRVKIKLNE